MSNLVSQGYFFKTPSHEAKIPENMETTDDLLYMKRPEVPPCHSYLSKDFSRLVDSQLMTADEIGAEMPVYRSKRKSCTRRKKSQQSDLEGILGFASLICETEQLLRCGLQADATSIRYDPLVRSDGLEMLKDSIEELTTNYQAINLVPTTGQPSMLENSLSFTKNFKVFNAVLLNSSPPNQAQLSSVNSISTSQVAISKIPRPNLQACDDSGVTKRLKVTEGVGRFNCVDVRRQLSDQAV